MNFIGMRGHAHLSDPQCGGSYHSLMHCDAFIKYALQPDVCEVRLHTPESARPTGDGLRGFEADLVVLFYDPGRRPLAIKVGTSLKFTERPEFAEMLTKAKAAYAARDYDFDYLTRPQVYTPALSEKQFVFRYVNNPADPLDELILRSVRTGREIPLKDLARSHESNGRLAATIVSAIWRLVATKALFIDFEKKISTDTLICSEPIVQNQK